jgi:hypothetical protein
MLLEKVNIMVLCDDVIRNNRIVNDINRRREEIASAVKRPGAVVSALSFAKTSDLNGTTDLDLENLDLVVLCCSGKVDPPYDLWVVRHRFPCASRISELDIDTEERAYHMICCWGADECFSQSEDVVEVIIRFFKSKMLIS